MMLTFFRDLPVSTKIISGYIIALLLMGLVGTLAIIQLNTINQTVEDLANDLAADQRLADRIIEHSLLTRLYANHYIRSPVEADLVNYNNEVEDLEMLLKQADADIQDEARRDLLANINTNIADYKETFTNIQSFIQNRNQVVDSVLNVQGPQAEDLLQQLRKSAFEDGDDLASFHAGEAQRAFLLMRFNVFRYLDVGDPQWLELFDQRYQQAQQAFEVLDRELEDPTRRALTNQAKESIDTYAQAFASVQDDYAQQNQATTRLDKLGADIRTDADGIASSVEVDFKAKVIETNELVWLTQSGLLVVMAVATIVGLGLGVAISRSITTPLSQVVTASTNVASGDLNQTVSIPSEDELGILGNAFNSMTASLREAQKNAVGKEVIEKAVTEYNIFIEKVAQGDLTSRLALEEELNQSTTDLITLGHNLNYMVENLERVTQQIRGATTNITSASAEILAATSQQASGSNEQSAAITQTTSTISEVQAIVEQNLSKAEEVANQSRQTAQISMQGQQAVEQTVDSMMQIRERVAGIAENILALSEQTQQIGEITATVNEIAAQSNLLALNASVEAARAGEHGKGFAVVAVEVRNLAEQSRQATAQVKTILNEIQQATNAAVMATEEGTKGVDAGVELTRQAGETIRQLSQNIDQSANMAQQIVASAQQQNTGVEQITIAMQNINQATVQALASTRQTERSAQDLSSVAQQLESLVTQYKLRA